MPSQWLPITMIDRVNKKKMLTRPRKITHGDPLINFSAAGVDRRRNSFRGRDIQRLLVIISATI